MTERPKPIEIHLRVPSVMDWLDVVDRVATGIAEQLNYSTEEANGLANSVLEAGTNAIQHGHRYDATLPVDFHFEIERDRIRILVHDCGPGFDVDKVLHADPTAPEFLLAPRGRGIFIMKSLMDDVSFRIVAGGGCTAILIKQHRVTD